MIYVMFQFLVLEENKSQAKSVSKKVGHGERLGSPMSSRKILERKPQQAMDFSRGINRITLEHIPKNGLQAFASIQPAHVFDANMLEAAEKLSRPIQVAGPLLLLHRLD